MRQLEDMERMVETLNGDNLFKALLNYEEPKPIKEENHFEQFVKSISPKEWETIDQILKRGEQLEKSGTILKATGKKDKAKLVPVKKQVMRNGKMITETFWVSSDEAKDIQQGKAPEEDKKQKSPKKEASDDNKPSKAKPRKERHSERDNDPHYQAVQELKKKHGSDKAMELAKQSGVNWDDHEHSGVNWMRASMAMRAHLKGGGKIESPKAKEEKPKSGEGASGGAQKFHIRTESGKWKETDGKKVNLGNDVTGFVHQTKDGKYIVSELKTGTKMSKEYRTSQEAIAEAKSRVESQKDNIGRLINNHVSINGASPTHEAQEKEKEEKEAQKQKEKEAKEKEKLKEQIKKEVLKEIKEFQKKMDDERKAKEKAEAKAEADKKKAEQDEMKKIMKDIKVGDDITLKLKSTGKRFIGKLLSVDTDNGEIVIDDKFDGEMDFNFNEVTITKGDEQKEQNEAKKKAEAEKQRVAKPFQKVYHRR